MLQASQRSCLAYSSRRPSFDQSFADRASHSMSGQGNMALRSRGLIVDGRFQNRGKSTITHHQKRYAKSEAEQTITQEASKAGTTAHFPRSPAQPADFFRLRLIKDKRRHSDGVVEDMHSRECNGKGASKDFGQFHHPGARHSVNRNTDPAPT